METEKPRWIGDGYLVRKCYCCRSDFSKCCNIFISTIGASVMTTPLFVFLWDHIVVGGILIPFLCIITCVNIVCASLCLIDKCVCEKGSITTTTTTTTTTAVPNDDNEDAEPKTDVQTTVIYVIKPWQPMPSLEQLPGQPMPSFGQQPDMTDISTTLESSSHDLAQSYSLLGCQSTASTVDCPLLSLAIPPPMTSG